MTNLLTLIMTVFIPLTKKPREIVLDKHQLDLCREKEK